MSESVERIAMTIPADQVLLEEAFRSYEAWLVRRLTLVVGDTIEAEDLAQQVWLRALERHPDLSKPIGPWLAAVGVRLALDVRRKRRRWGFLPLPEAESTSPISTDPDLWRALAGLDPKHRAALILTVLDGFTQAEVAEGFGVSRNVVASWLSRARRRLRPILEE